MNNDNSNEVTFQGLHNVTSQYQNPTMQIISMLEPIAKKLNENECYNEIALINKISVNCYLMLKISFYISEYRLLNDDKVTFVNNRICINEYLDNILTALKLMLTAAGFNLNFDICDEKIMFNIDDTYLSKALFLLIAHGCSDAPIGASINVSLKKINESAIITITDESSRTCTENIDDFLTTDGCHKVGCEDAMMFPIARKIIKLMGGNIFASVKQDLGNTITVSLPTQQDDDVKTELFSSTRRYLTNRYSDMHIIFSSICKPTFF